MPPNTLSWTQDAWRIYCHSAMKLQQLRYVLEIVRQGNHLSAAAEALHTSQPGVSRQIQLLEAELGFAIFLRTRNRIVGLTEPGQQIIAIAQRVVTDMEALRSLKDEIGRHDRGRLVIATTHTMARYVLPKVIGRFVRRFPEVQLVLKQGNPEDVCGLVETGDADLAVCTETRRGFPHLVRLPCFPLNRSVIAKVGHPVLHLKQLTLRGIAAYPLITYDSHYSGSWKVMGAFEKEGIRPNVVLNAVDADVSKTYVELGLGIAILADVAFDPARDRDLRARSASHLFEPSTTYVSLRANIWLRPFVLDFIGSIAPELTAKVIGQALKTRLARAAG